MANTDQAGVESIIGKGTKVNGNVTFGALARIEGEVEGEVSGTQIIIAQGATVLANITAATVIVAGRVKGQITARERIELVATAQVEGILTTPRLTLSEGAKFDGDCRMPRERLAA